MRHLTSLLTAAADQKPDDCPPTPAGPVSGPSGIGTGTPAAGSTSLRGPLGPYAGPMDGGA